MLVLRYGSIPLSGIVLLLLLLLLVVVLVLLLVLLLMLLRGCDSGFGVVVLMGSGVGGGRFGFSLAD